MAKLTSDEIGTGKCYINYDKLTYVAGFDPEERKVYFLIKSEFNSDKLYAVFHGGNYLVSEITLPDDCKFKFIPDDGGDIITF